MTDDRAVLVDTNVLLSATSLPRPLHRAAAGVLNEWPNQGMILVTSSQVLREYLVVSTRPVEVNGLGLSLPDALANTEAFRGRMRLLVDDERVWDRLRALIGAHGILGKQIHDANLVATALTFGVSRLVTANAGDFKRFSSEIEVIDLSALTRS